MCVYDTLVGSKPNSIWYVSEKNTLFIPGKTSWFCMTTLKKWATKNFHIGMHASFYPHVVFTCSHVFFDCWAWHCFWEGHDATKWMRWPQCDCQIPFISPRQIAYQNLPPWTDWQRRFHTKVVNSSGFQERFGPSEAPIHPTLFGGGTRGGEMDGMLMIRVKDTLW